MNKSNEQIALRICGAFVHLSPRTSETQAGKSKQPLFDSRKAREWLQIAERSWPYDKRVVELKERLFDMMMTTTTTSVDEADSSSWETFLLNALVLYHLTHSFNSEQTTNNDPNELLTI